MCRCQLKIERGEFVLDKGGGKTPPMVVELLKSEVAKKSQSAVARETGLTLLTVQRYLKGIGEPRGKNLKRLSDYFGVSVPFLRGEAGSPEDMIIQFIHNNTTAIKSGSDDDKIRFVEDFIKNNPDAGFTRENIFNPKTLESLIIFENEEIERLKAETARLKAENQALKMEIHIEKTRNKQKP